MIDEVYTAQRVEYINGTFIELSENGVPAKTVFVFAVQSTCDKYKNVVCFLPINKLNTTNLCTWFIEVMKRFKEVENYERNFFLIVVSVYNYNFNSM